MPAPDDPSLDAMLHELEQDDPVWGRVREKLGEQADEKGTPTMDGTYLTPDALLYYCDAQLEGLDSQMNGIMNQQNSVNADEEHLKDAIDAMDQYNGGNPMDLIRQLRTDAAQITDPATQAKLNAVADDMSNSLVSVQPGPSNAPAYVPFSSTQIQNWTDSVKNIDSDLGSGSELAMIQLQSLMSERQVEIQLTTNLVQSLGDQANKIADNIGHS